MIKAYRRTSFRYDFIRENHEKEINFSFKFVSQEGKDKKKPHFKGLNLHFEFFNILNHIYFLCVFDFFLFIVTIHTIISLRKKIMIPESISSGILNPDSIIEIEITDKQIIGVLPNKTIIKDLSEFTNYMIVKDGIFLMMNNKKEKKYILYIPSKKQELILLFKEKKIKGI